MNHPAAVTFTIEAAADAMRDANQQLRCAGERLMRGDLPDCAVALKATHEAVGAALDSLAGCSVGA